MSAPGDYDRFLDGKRHSSAATGREPTDLHPSLYPFQRAITQWAIRRGRAAIFAGTGLGKALDAETPVLTPTGFCAIGGIRPGDSVIGADGKATEVLGVFPQGSRQGYRVTFSDGSSVVCDVEHMWTVRTKKDKHQGHGWRTLTLNGMMETGIGASGDGRHGRWFIPMVGPVEFTERGSDLPLHPYVVGCLIGDGYIAGRMPYISSADEELINTLNELLPLGVGAVKKQYSKYDYAIGRINAGEDGRRGGHWPNQVVEALTELGLWGHRAESKFIPDVYKFSSVETRTWLLQGIFDTDGGVWQTRGCPVIEFCTVSPRLASDVQFLVQSLGGRARIHTKHTTGQLAYRMHPSFPRGVRPFRLSRKAALWRDRDKYIPTRSIRSIEGVGLREMVCIKVAAADGLFVVNDCIVTHNTRMQIEWSRQSGDRVLIVSPLAVAEQTIAEAEKLNVTIRKVARPTLEPGIEITNYEKLRHFVGAPYDAIVLDECFAPDTPVDVVENGVVVTCPILKIRVGDTIVNASGHDVVSDVHRRRVPYAVVVTVEGRPITCSPNHPFFTKRGWIGAQDLEPGDTVLHAPTAMRLVREGTPREISERDQEAWALLRQILLSEMADASARGVGKGSQPRSSGAARGQASGLSEIGMSSGASRDRAYPAVESVITTRGASEDIPHVESDSPQTFRAWGQWQGIDRATAIADGCTWTGLGCGMAYLTGSEAGRISHLLQTRLGERRAASRHRGGWVLPRESEGSGLKEGRDAGFAGVDGLEVLKPDDSRLDSYRDADGELYFYDLGGTRHPSFSVGGVLVHNSSIMKSVDGKTRTLLLEQFTSIPSRLCCTATPAPNDISEMANHAEFLGVMRRVEMLATFFVHDDDGWRLKGHASDPFYRWMATWAVYIRQPSDLGFDDGAFVLPPLSVEPEIVNTDWRPDGMLLPAGLGGIGGRSKARKGTMDARIERAVSLLGGSDQWLVWCGLNDEGRSLARVLGGECVNIEGKDTDDEKVEKLSRWVRGEVRICISKVKIFGFGLNLQHCHRMLFLGLSDSWEAYFQAIRRCWRFGQSSPVTVKVVTSNAEVEVISNVKAKEEQAMHTVDRVVEHMKDAQSLQVRGVDLGTTEYAEAQVEGDGWKMLLGDSVTRIAELDPASVALSVYSPPFASLYTYSNSPRDLGNSRDYAQFFEHYNYLVTELARVTMPGRRTAVHCQQVSTTLATHGRIGWRDFRGDLIRCYESHGWIYDGEVVIDKDPQAQAIRTHSKQLMFVQKARDSSWLRPAMADYILLFRAPGDNAVPIIGDVSNEEWILWARPIWYGIRESNTLNAAAARSEKDERHIAPLQLETIERCVRLWSNPGELVFSPFAGIGSEGYVSLQHGRKFVGIELKREYYDAACRNLKGAVRQQAFAFVGGVP